MVTQYVLRQSGPKSMRADLLWRAMLTPPPLTRNSASGFLEATVVLALDILLFVFLEASAKRCLYNVVLGGWRMNDLHYFDTKAIPRSFSVRLMYRNHALGNSVCLVFLWCKTSRLQTDGWSKGSNHHWRRAAIQYQTRRDAGTIRLLYMVFLFNLVHRAQVQELFIRCFLPPRVCSMKIV